MMPVDTPAAESKDLTRRAFHLAAVYVLGALIGLAMAIPTLLYLLVPSRSRKETGFIDAGDVSQLTPGVPVEVSFQQSRIDGWKLSTVKKTAWVVKEASNNVIAYGPQCTHLGCAYHWDMSAGKFICPCHASYFSVEGKVLDGPAPRPLDRYVTKVVDNRLQIGDLKQSTQA